MNDDWGTFFIIGGLSFLFWPFLIPIVLVGFLAGSAVFTIFLGAAALALGGLALGVLLAIAAGAGIILVTIVCFILSLFTKDGLEDIPRPVAIIGLLLAAVISALVFYYFPVHPIRTNAEDVSYITVTDQSGEHVIEYDQYVEIYMRELKELRMHRSFRTVTEEDFKDHCARLVLHDKEGAVLDTFLMLDDTYFTIQRAKMSESFKAYTVLGELHDYNEFIKIYEDNETHREFEEAYDHYEEAFKEFEASLSAEGTQLHFRIPVVEDTDDFSVRGTLIYYKEPEEGKINNRAVDKVYEGIDNSYWVEGQDYYLELAGKEYYEVSLNFGCGGVAKEYHVLKYMPVELHRPAHPNKK